MRKHTGKTTTTSFANHNHNKLMKQLPPITITISGHNENDSLSITMSPHSNIEEYLEIFKVMLMYQGFHIATILEYLDFDDYIFNED